MNLRFISYFDVLQTAEELGLSEQHVERTIDDFVFIALLLGNDFIPPLITSDLDSGLIFFLVSVIQSSTDGFPRTLQTYKDIRLLSTLHCPPSFHLIFTGTTLLTVAVPPLTCPSSSE